MANKYDNYDAYLKDAKDFQKEYTDAEDAFFDYAKAVRKLYGTLELIKDKLGNTDSVDADARADMLDNLDKAISYIRQHGTTAQLDTLASAGAFGNSALGQSKRKLFPDEEDQNFTLSVRRARRKAISRYRRGY